MLVQESTLLAATGEILQSLGESPENAAIVAAAMVRADLRGVTTHGTYLLEVIKMRQEGGQIRLPTQVTLVSDSDATALLDGGDGIGMVAADKALDIAMEKAQRFGIGMTLIRNTNNVGTLATYTQKAADQGMIAFMCGNAASCMAPWGGSEAFVGTSPVSVAIPSATTFNADMALTVVARGKIRKANRNGEAIPDNWATDSEGNATTNPAAALKGTLLPIGGAKGAGLALAVDIVSGLLSGSGYGQNIKSFHVLDGPTRVGACIIVIDPARFMPRDLFQSTLTSYIAAAKAVKKIPGVEEILMPGEIEQRKEDSSRVNGIKLDDSQAEKMQATLQAIGSTLVLYS